MYFYLNFLEFGLFGGIVSTKATKEFKAIALNLWHVMPLTIIPAGRLLNSVHFHSGVIRRHTTDTRKQIKLSHEIQPQKKWSI